MNCQNIRSVIDVGSRREPQGETVKAHLRGCTDCRRYADETSALLTLISAQPRVQAPADFNFKLRARIAKSQVEPRPSLAILEKFWVRSFSWGQAITATATLALVATFTALHFTNSNPPMTSTQEGPTVAVATAKIDQVTPAITAGSAVAAKPTLPVTRPVAMRVSPRMSRMAITSERPAVVEQAKVQVVAGNAANNEESWRAYNAEKGQIVSTPNRALIGAEGSGTHLAKAAVFVPSI